MESEIYKWMNDIEWEMQQRILAAQNDISNLTHQLKQLNNLSMKIADLKKVVLDDFNTNAVKESTKYYYLFKDMNGGKKVVSSKLKKEEMEKVFDEAEVRGMFTLCSVDDFISFLRTHDKDVEEIKLEYGKF